MAIWLKFCNYIVLKALHEQADKAGPQPGEAHNYQLPRPDPVDVT